MQHIDGMIAAIGRGRIKKLAPLSPTGKRADRIYDVPGSAGHGPLPDPDHVAFRLARTIRDLRAAGLDVTTQELDAAGYARPDRVKYIRLAAAIADALDQADAAGEPATVPEAVEAVYRSRFHAFQ